jgi:hypothetical protein
MLLVIQTVASSDWIIVNNELKGSAWKWLCSDFRYYPCICVEGLRKNSEWWMFQLNFELVMS